MKIDGFRTGRDPQNTLSLLPVGNSSVWQETALWELGWHLVV
jgi:hypothetical protein